MGRLEERLAKIREGAKERIPEEVRRTMARATGELKSSGIVERAAAVGEEAPGFVRLTPDGERIGLGELLKEGPVVLSFFRGRW